MSLYWCIMDKAVNTSCGLNSSTNTEVTFSSGLGRVFLKRARARNHRVQIKSNKLDFGVKRAQTEIRFSSFLLLEISKNIDHLNHSSFVLVLVAGMFFWRRSHRASDSPGGQTISLICASLMPSHQRRSSNRRQGRVGETRADRQDQDRPVTLSSLRPGR